VTTVEPAYVVGPTVGATPADNAPAMIEVFSPIRKNNASPSVNTRASSRHKKVTSGTRKSDRTAPAPPRDRPKIRNSSPNRSVKATSKAYMTLRNLSVRKDVKLKSNKAAKKPLYSRLADIAPPDLPDVAVTTSNPFRIRCGSRYCCAASHVSMSASSHVFAPPEEPGRYHDVNVLVSSSQLRI